MTRQSHPNPDPAGQPHTRGAKEGFLASVLDPVDRLVEGIYTVLIVMTFTLAVRAVDTQAAAAQGLASTMVSQLFWAALGCAVAWGLIDGVMYVLTCVFERGKERRLFREIRDVTSEEEGIAVLAGELDDDLAALTTEQERHGIYGALYRRLRTSPPPPTGFARADFAGALGIVLIAVGVALPVVLPLLLDSVNPLLAVRLSNLVAFAMLFWMGYRWARYAGGKPARTGLLLLLLGVVMVVVAIPLGG